ncbi:ABC transporter permease [bacterium]|jgi:spermidine/putrescine transport system permease protein|nr:ABC transporter permease [bacterium]MBT5014981.1 ABC transporter permease [bacterium]
MKKIVLQEMHFFLSIPAIIWQVVFLWLPLLLLACISFYSKSYGISLVHYWNICDISHFKVIFRSLLLASVNSFLCLAFAYPIAYFLAFRAHRAKDLLLFFLTLPFWVNFLLHVYSWFFVLERNGILNDILLRFHIINEPLYLANSLFAIGLVMFHSYLPFMVLPLYIIFEKLNYSLIESSADLGATVSQTFMRITFPLTLSGARIGFFLVFILSFGEFLIPTLMGGGKLFFVGTLISNYFLLDQNLAVGAAFTTLSGVVLSGALLIAFLMFEYVYYKTTRAQ